MHRGRWGGNITINITSIVYSIYGTHRWKTLSLFAFNQMTQISFFASRVPSKPVTNSERLCHSSIENWHRVVSMKWKNRTPNRKRIISRLFIMPIAVSAHWFHNEQDVWINKLFSVRRSIPMLIWWMNREQLVDVPRLHKWNSFN